MKFMCVVSNYTKENSYVMTGGRMRSIYKEWIQVVSFDTLAEFMQWAQTVNLISCVASR